MKISSILMFFVGMLGLIAGYTNLTYPAVNCEFIRHTLTMDTTFDSLQRKRAINIPAIYLHYLISIGEILSGSISLISSIMYFLGHKYAYVTAQIGLLISVLIWFFGFRVIAGEYFGMWQSKNWNGLPDAERIVITLLGIWGIIKKDV